MSVRRSDQRARNACLLCRERKRKCDGEKPCSNCQRFHDECTYVPRRRPNNPRAPSKQAKPAKQAPGRVAGNGSNHSMENPASHRDQLQNLEANSPAVFVKLLGRHMDAPAASLPRLQCYAWNLGLGLSDQPALGSESLDITNIVSLAEMRERALVFFAEVHPVYNFLDQQEISSAISQRWLANSESPSTTPDNSHPATSTENASIDSVLCGIAALAGLLRGLTGQTEARLVQATRTSLERATSLDSATVKDVIAWLLRVIYLRMTSSPHATWMACSTLMHMVEAAKLHFDSSRDSILAETLEDCSLDQRRRIYCVSQLFNMWVSLDCGKTSVGLRGASSALPVSVWSPDQIALWRMSEFLNPDNPRDQSELANELNELYAIKCSHSMLELLRCNIALCIFRRIRSLRCNLSDTSVGQILSLADSSLQAATALIDRRLPWWHISNIPFQLVCVFLVIDNWASLSRIGKALEVLERVADTYRTKTTQESYEVACKLVDMKRRQRLEDLALLDSALRPFDLVNASGPSPTQLPNLPWPAEPSDSNGFGFETSQNHPDGYDLSQIFLPG